MLAADDAGWPDDPEFRAAIRGYIDWAVDTVALSHPHDTDVPAGLPLPRWSWDGLEPAHETRPVSQALDKHQSAAARACAQYPSSTCH